MQTDDLKSLSDPDAFIARADNAPLLRFMRSRYSV